MKTYDVNENEVKAGLPVDMQPYPKIVLGDGGNKRATWIAIGQRDQSQLIQANGKNGQRIFEAAVVITAKGQPLLVAPRNGDNRALVLWRVPSGYRGDARITAPEGVRIIASDQSWHSGRGNLGSTAEALVVLEPGQYLEASRSGRRVQENRARLTWTGSEIEVVFYNSEANPFGPEDGEYI